MAQVASAFPTAGGLYHWASLLGGRGWGWAVAWLNLAGLVAALAAIDVGAFAFVRGWLTASPADGPAAPASPLAQAVGVAAIVGSQAAPEPRGVRLISRLMDLSGYLILVVAAALTVAMLGCAPHLDPTRLVTFANYSGAAGGGVWPASASLARLVRARPAPAALHDDGLRRLGARGGGDRRGRGERPPGDRPLGARRGAGRVGDAGGRGGGRARPAGRRGAGRRGVRVRPRGRPAGGLGESSALGIAAAMYGCGLGALLSASRMAYAFARDGGLPFSATLRRVGSARTPAAAIWAVAVASWLFTLWTPAYATITAVCAILLYLSYVTPTPSGRSPWAGPGAGWGRGTSGAGTGRWRSWGCSGPGP